jgi:cell division protein FtsZ
MRRAGGLAQVNEAAEVIYDLVDPTANLIFGAVIDPRLGQEVRSPVSAPPRADLLTVGPP